MTIVAKHGVADDSDAYEVVLRDGEMHAVVRLRGELIWAHKGRPLDLVQLVAMEVQGVLNQLEAIRKNIPTIGLWARRKGVDERRQIIGVDRRHTPPNVRFVDVAESVSWGDCEYAP